MNLGMPSGRKIDPSSEFDARISKRPILPPPGVEERHLRAKRALTIVSSDHMEHARKTKAAEKLLKNATNTLSVTLTALHEISNTDDIAKTLPALQLLARGLKKEILQASKKGLDDGKLSQWQDDLGRIESFVDKIVILLKHNRDVSEFAKTLLVIYENTGNIAQLFYGEVVKYYDHLESTAPTIVSRPQAPRGV